jgi:hypothetical protein
MTSDIPQAGAAVQLSHPIGLLIAQVAAQQVAEQVMIAIPFARVVERREKEISPIQLVEDGLAV